MFEDFKRDALKAGVKAAIVSISVLADIKAYFAALEEENELNNFQKLLIRKRFVLNPPDDKTKSIIIAVWPRELVRLIFHHNGKSAACLTEKGVLQKPFEEIFAKTGFALTPEPMLPLKHLAVRCGLNKYGRNNITFCGDRGSFIRIGAYFTDMPAEVHTWRDVVIMPQCEACGLCVQACVTTALQPRRFLMDNEKCLTYYNRQEIPDWVPPHAHNALYGCYRCQAACPANFHRLAGAPEIVFTESEVHTMLMASSFADFPAEIKKKLGHIDYGQEMPFVPRNLQLLLDNSRQSD